MVLNHPRVQAARFSFLFFGWRFFWALVGLRSVVLGESKLGREIQSSSGIDPVCITLVLLSCPFIDEDDETRTPDTDRIPGCPLVSPSLYFSCLNSLLGQLLESWLGGT
ncbi:hypothetical protein CC2G_004520 [Coprinopsis cinerea AmutBmut pab1-1]|nr:hypothetical protein CC2G_004520 [Coprinopsis cinerea AmutBmut pab1-1]